MKILLAISLLLNVLIAWWGSDQVRIGKKIVARWESRDQERRESIKILSHFVEDKTTREDLIPIIKMYRSNYFEKEGILEAGDLSFLTDGENIIKVEAFKYEDKTL